MKRIIVILFLIVISNVTYSQIDSKKPIFEENSKKDLATLKKIVNVQPEQELAILDFFIRKQKQYTVYNMTPEYREKILKDFEIELKSLINPQEVSKLDKDKKILTELISDK